METKLIIHVSKSMVTHQWIQPKNTRKIIIMVMASRCRVQTPHISTLVEKLQYA